MTRRKTNLCCYGYYMIQAKLKINGAITFGNGYKNMYDNKKP